MEVKLSSTFSKFFPVFRRERKGRGNTRRLRPPLEDRQAEPYVCLCALCGGEQYHRDRTGLWRGRTVCAACLSRLGEEEENELL